MYSSNMSSTRWTSRLLIGFLALVALVGLWKVGQHALFELRGSFESDVGIYMTVARGMTQGLVPYTEIFENKAPGILLLAATSIRLFGDHALLTMLQALFILLLPFVVALPVYLWHRRLDADTLLAFGVGAALAVHAGLNAGRLLPESFGALFAAGFIAVIALMRQRPAVQTQALLALLLLGAASMKEPFVLSIIGGILLLMPFRRAWHALLAPFLASAAAGALGLLLLGILGAYVSVQLPHIFGHQIFLQWGSLGEPLWLRTVDLPRIAANLAALSPLLPVLVGFFWLGSLLIAWREGWGSTGRWALASWCTTLSVGFTGDFYWHHFVFAFPFSVACLLRCLRFSDAHLSAMHRQVVTAAVGLLTLLTLGTMKPDYDALWRSWEEWSAPRRAAAQTLDTVMDRCGIDHYFNDIDRADMAPFGFARHVPYGPIFNQYARFIGALPAYLEGFARALDEAQILIMRTEKEGAPVGPDTRAFIRDAFTNTPPPCAGAFEQPSPFRIRFRKK